MRVGDVLMFSLTFTVYFLSLLKKKQPRLGGEINMSGDIEQVINTAQSGNSKSNKKCFQ